MTVQEIRALTALSRQDFSDRLLVPLSVLEDWECNNTCPEYVARWLECYVTHTPGFVKSAAEEYGEQLKALRAKTGLSQQKFGDWLGIPKRTIQDWECGKAECKKYVFDLIMYVVEHVAPSVSIVRSFDSLDDLIMASGLSVEDFSSYFHVPTATVNGWMREARRKNSYLIAFMELKLRQEGLLD